MGSKTKTKPSIFKIIRNILLILLSILILFFVVLFIVHKMLSVQEYNQLDEAGYVNSVSAGEYNLNVSKYGNENGNHTLVAMSGMGVQDYSVMLRNVTDSLADDNEIVFVDRAGYGLSDDTDIEQTTQRIVEDYRTALKNAGCEGPYVLLPHSLGGVYATYWESMYPEEIEGVVFIDTTELQEGVIFDDIEKSGLWNRIEIFGCNVGMQRLLYDNYILPPSVNASEEQATLSKSLYIRSMTSNAALSENDLINDNCKTAYDNIVTNDIPKVYISASSFTETEQFSEYAEYVNERLIRGGSEAIFDTSGEEFVTLAEKTIEAVEERNETILFPYFEKLGNCDYKAVPGDHYIYEQKPEECLQIISEFLDTLD